VLKIQEGLVMKILSKVQVKFVIKHSIIFCAGTNGIASRPLVSTITTWFST